MSLDDLKYIPIPSPVWWKRIDVRRYLFITLPISICIGILVYLLTSIMEYKGDGTPLTLFGSIIFTIVFGELCAFASFLDYDDRQPKYFMYQQTGYPLMMAEVEARSHDQAHCKSVWIPVGLLLGKEDIVIDAHSYTVHKLAILGWNSFHPYRRDVLKIINLRVSDALLSPYPQHPEIMTLGVPFKDLEKIQMIYQIKSK